VCLLELKNRYFKKIVHIKNIRKLRYLKVKIPARIGLSPPVVKSGLV
jgi:hypothetical protein